MRYVLMLACTAVLAGALPAQVPQTPAEVAKYVANMQDMQKYAQALKHLNAAARANPALKPLIELRNDRSFSETIKGHPQLVAALQRAGLTPVQYEFLSGLMLLAGFAQLAASDAEAMKLLKEAGVHPDNYLFFKKYGDQISVLNKAAQ